jgi:hypothetical protein
MGREEIAQKMPQHAMQTSRCHSPLFRPRPNPQLRYVHSGGVALQVARFEQSARHRRPAGETGIACPARGESSTRGNN